MKDKSPHFEIVIDRKIKDQDLPTMVVTQVIKHISTGTLKPGDKLPSELEMTRRFGISRISLREAMKLLEAKGYIESHGRKGKYVKSVVDNSLINPIEGLIINDAKNINKLMEVKRVIDVESAAIVAERAKPSDIESLKSILEEAKNLSGSRESVHDMRIKKYSEFYKKFSYSMDNSIYTHVLITISKIFKEILKERKDCILFHDEKVTNVISQLYGIIDAVENKNPALAKEEMSKHIEYMSQELCS